MIVEPQKFNPREHQRVAASFMLNTPRCALFAVPGLGKTSSVYKVLDILKLAGSSFFPVLVIAPKKVCELVWPSEALKWFDFHGIRVIQILGERDARDDALLRKGDVYVINYENIQWLVQKLGKRWPFKIVVADESTKLKNFRLKDGGARSTALSQIAMHTGRWVNLTGIPAPNGLKDLWGQMWFIDFGHRLGRTYTDFMRRWFIISEYTREVEPRVNAKEEIYAAIADVTLALRAEDWFSIHESNEITREVDLPPPARALYDRMERELFVELESGDVNAINRAALSNKLLQMTAGFVYGEEKQAHFLHDAKVEGLRSIVNELGGEPLLLAYWYKPEVPMIKKEFPEFRVYKTKQDEDDWNAGKIPLMGVHPASAGHGVNLQYGGRAMAFFTQTWDWELRSQVIERIGPVRQKQAGLDRAVLLYNLVARNTLDEEVIERNITKESVNGALMKARAHRKGDTPSWSELV